MHPSRLCSESSVIRPGHRGSEGERLWRLELRLDNQLSGQQTFGAFERWAIWLNHYNPKPTAFSKGSRTARFSGRRKLISKRAPLIPTAFRSWYSAVCSRHTSSDLSTLLEPLRPALMLPRAWLSLPLF